jgi:TRAP-type C4-dicarboxylate transport system substrate-binding protein
VHGDGVFHLRDKPIKSLADFKGLKLRAPTRQTNKFLAALGATPVAMPVPAVGEAIAKGVIDGAVVPYEVVPSVKLQELVKFHSETDPAEPAFYTSTFLFAMNKAKYDALPADLKKVIDANSGQALSGQIGKTFLAADGEGKKLTARNTTNVIPAAELANWKKVGQGVTDAWVADMNAKGANGQQLLEAARALIAKHAAGK